MDLRAYYRKIRETAQAIASEDVVVVSTATPGGGRAGVRTEVPRDVAARMLVEGTARLASEAESRQFQEERLAAKRAVDEAAAARNVKFTVIPAGEWKNARGTE
jgi:hypothetical protein